MWLGVGAPNHQISHPLAAWPGNHPKYFFLWFFLNSTTKRVKPPSSQRQPANQNEFELVLVRCIVPGGGPFFAPVPVWRFLPRSPFGVFCPGPSLAFFAPEAVRICTLASGYGEGLLGGGPAYVP